MTVPRPPRPVWTASGKLAKNEDQAAFELSWLSERNNKAPAVVDNVEIVLLRHRLDDRSVTREA